MKEYFKKEPISGTLFLRSVLEVVYLSFYCYLITREYIVIIQKQKIAMLKTIRSNNKVLIKQNCLDPIGKEADM